MNIYSQLSLIVFVIYIFMGFYALKLDKKSKLNQIFFILSIAMGLWSFFFVFFYSAPNKEIAFLFYKLSALGRCTHPSLLLIFALALTHNKWLKNKLLLILLCIPPLIFVLETFTAPFITSDLTQVGGVWYEVLLSNSPWWIIYSAYFMIYDIVALFLVWNWGQKTQSTREKKQSIIIFYSATAVLFIALLLNSLFPSLHIYYIPAIGQIVGAVIMVSIWWAITRYKLMNITPSLAAESIMDKVTDMVILLDAERLITSVNSRCEQLLSYNESELKGRDISLFIKDKEQQTMVYNKLPKLKLKSDHSDDYSSPQGISLTYTCKKGTEIPVQAFLSVIKNENDIIGYSIVAQDQRPTNKLKKEISERLSAQKEVKKHLKALESLNKIIVSMNHATDVESLMKEALYSSLELLEFQKGGVYLIENEEAHLKINKGILKDMEKYQIIHLSQEPFNSILIHSHSFISDNYPEDNPLNAKKWNIKSVAAVPLSFKEEILGMMVVLGENEHHFLETEKEILESIGNETGAAIHRIISEEKIRSSLEEKEILLKEIHHRVKNNMQIISSLLNLQKSYVNDKEAVNVLQESQGRVLSMSMVHEKLYRSGDMGNIDLENYLQSLTKGIMLSFQNPKHEVTLEVSAPDIIINIDTIMPLGLLVNELVTNAFKYAFKGRKKGKIKVKVESSPQGYQLLVEDDGIGLPENFEIETQESLGLLLVKTLTYQLDGQLKIEGTHGTAFKISFHEIEYIERY